MKTIKEKNRIIANYMGIINPSADNEGLLELNTPDGYIICPFHESEIRYRLSWDWLMTVVEKIVANCDRFMVKCDEGKAYCEIGVYKVGEVVKDIEVFRNNMIEAVYNAVVEYIEYKKSINQPSFEGNGLKRLKQDGETLIFRGPGNELKVYFKDNLYTLELNNEVLLSRKTLGATNYQVNRYCDKLHLARVK